MALAPFYLRGRYVEPWPDYEEEMAKQIMREFELERTQEYQQRVDFMRAYFGNQMYAFKIPTPQTILDYAKIGCKTVDKEGNATCKIWIHCPEDTKISGKEFTYIVDDVVLPALYCKPI